MSPFLLAMVVDKLTDEIRADGGGIVDILDKGC